MITPPPPLLPADAARAGLDAWLLAIGAGPSLATDPHRTLKMHTMDRLLLNRMPVLCSGGSALHVLHTWEMRGLVMLTGGAL